MLLRRAGTKLLCLHERWRDNTTSNEKSTLVLELKCSLRRYPTHARQLKRHLATGVFIHQQCKPCTLCGFHAVPCSELPLSGSNLATKNDGCIGRCSC